MTLMQIIARVITMKEESEEYQGNKTIHLSEKVFLDLIEEVLPGRKVLPNENAEYQEGKRVYSLYRRFRSDLDVEQVMIKLIKEIEV